MRLVFGLLSTAAFPFSTNNNNNINSDNNMSVRSSRTIERVVKATQNGPLTRLIGTVDIDGKGTEHALSQVDPFILLDTAYLPKRGLPPFGAHPHRGHSVVTILMQGKIKSWDSFRASKSEFDVMAAPGSYWVDAGTGVFHDETSVMDDENDPNQHVKLYQLWVGVQETDRAKPPRVQYDTNLPTFDCVNNDNDAASPEVVGQGIYYVGPKTSLETPHPVTVAHITQKAGTTYKVPIPALHGGFVVSMQGNANFGGTSAQHDHDVLVLTNYDEDKSSENKNDAPPDFLQVSTQADQDAQYLVCSGQRIGEPWAKKLVANGALFAATPEEARDLAPKVEAMAQAGNADDNGSFAPFGV